MEFIAHRNVFLHRNRKFLLLLKQLSAFFSPPKNISRCITVLTSTYSDTKFFIDHVKALKLKMNIYFLGYKLPEAIRLLNSIVNINLNNKTKKNVPTKYLVFHWTPSEILNGSIKYKPVVMPSCELYKNDTNNCRYDIIPISIYFNDKVKESDDLMDVIRRLHFPSMKPMIDLYEDFVREIDKIYMQRKANQETSESAEEDVYNEIACKWLQQNRNVYNIGHQDSWVKKSDDRREISIGGMWVITWVLITSL